MKYIVAVLLALTPLAAQAAGPVCNAVWSDAAREGRAIPVRIRMPEGMGPAPVILFSHGLGGSTDSGRAWAQAWANAGMIVINLQHPGSDRSIIAGGKAGIRNAMGGKQLIARAKDVSFAIDELGRRKREGDCDLSRADLTRIGMSGHSFGAHTTQAIAGQVYAISLGTLADPRVKAAIAFSPAPPSFGSPERAFGSIAIPFFSITGTIDTVPLTPDVTADDRTVPFAKMPPGGKYLLVMDGANHMAFNGRGDRGFDAGALTPHVEQVVTKATIVFWRLTLLGDKAAGAELDKTKLGLTGADRFEAK